MFKATWILGFLVATGSACAPARSSADAQSDNPMGPSFWLIPVPSSDDSLLGRVFQKPPDTALSLEEQSQPNPCGDQLADVASAEMHNRYENAVDVSTRAGGSGLLGLFGFSADASHATHLVYKVSTQKKLGRIDTQAYVECCKAKDCGWGYVSSLIYGSGEYASATRTNVAAEGNYTVYSAGLSHSYSALNKRKVGGYVAAVLTAHDRSQSVQACPPGHEWAKIECVEKGEIESQRAKCQGQRSSVMELIDVKEVDQAVKKNACSWLTEHGQPH